MTTMRLLVLSAVVLKAASKSHRPVWSMAHWEASHKHSGPCQCQSGEWGQWGEDMSCYKESSVGLTFCAPPAGPEYHPGHVDVQGMVADLPQPPSEESGLTFENGPVIGFIVNQLSPGQCLDVKDGTNYLQMHKCEFDWDNATTDQIWKIRADGFIENVKYPGMCIDVIGNPAVQDQDRAQLHYCEFGWQLNDQQWTMTKVGFLKSHLNPSKCLDVKGVAQTQEDSDIVMYECDEVLALHPTIDPDQTWKLFSVVPVPNPGPAQVVSTPAPGAGPSVPPPGSPSTSDEDTASGKPAGAGGDDSNSFPDVVSTSSTPSQAQEEGQSTESRSTSNAPNGSLAEGSPSTSAPPSEPSSAPEGGQVVPGTTSVPNSDQIEGQSETTLSPEGNTITDGKHSTCTCGDGSVGTFDASFLFCMKGENLCSKQTKATRESGSASSWLTWVVLILIVSFLVVGIAYAYGSTSLPKKTRDLSLVPGSAGNEDEASDEEASDEETQGVP